MKLQGFLQVLVVLAVVSTAEAISIRDKIMRFINETTEAIVESLSNITTIDESPSTPSTRRVWITYEKGQHVSALSSMENHRTISTTLNPLFDFPAMNGIVTTATDEEIAALMANATNGVFNVTDDPIRYPMVHISQARNMLQGKPRNMQQQEWDGQAFSYGIPLTQVDQLWSATGLDGAGITVCVIDSGLDVNHVDFIATSYTGESQIAGSVWSSDSNGHGTHVTGIIAATNNTIGLVGVAPKVKIHTVDIFGDNGFTYASALVDAAYKCRDAGAKVISMSLGGQSFSEQENALFTEFYNFNGILSVAAGGNSGNSLYSFPASYDNVLSVGAVDENKILSDFSQYNDRIDLVAPGVGIWSTLPMSSSCEICLQIGRNSYGPLDGTSQATPFVSGIAALLWSYDPTLSVQVITGALLNSAEDLGTTGRDNMYGNGLVSALNAYNLLTSSPSITPPPNNDSTEPPLSDPNETLPPSTCAEASLIFRTDAFPYETFVTLTDLYSGTVLWSGGVDLADTDYILTSECLDTNGCYEFQFIDTAGDGLCCVYGQGYFELSYNGIPVIAGDTFGTGVSYLLGDGCQV